MKITKYIYILALFFLAACQTNTMTTLSSVDKRLGNHYVSTESSIPEIYFENDKIILTVKSNFLDEKTSTVHELMKQFKLVDAMVVLEKGESAFDGDFKAWKKEYETVPDAKVFKAIYMTKGVVNYDSKYGSNYIVLYHPVVEKVNDNKKPL